MNTVASDIVHQAVASTHTRTLCKSWWLFVLQSNCLFDTSDLQSDKSSSSSPCGSIRLTLAYNDTRELMTVTVHEAHNIPSQERGGANQTQVRMLLLPARKIRQKTKVKSGENPHFEEVLDFRVLRGEHLCRCVKLKGYTVRIGNNL